MKLHFKHQPFQADAVEAVCRAFSGQPYSASQFQVDQGVNDRAQDSFGYDALGWKNEELKLSETDLLKNLQSVQKDNGLLPNSKLEYLRSNVEWEDRRKEPISRPVFTVEMETGTGKTYTYIKTMYELNARYGWSKFIIVVPSVAIREGVAKTFEITAEHFKQDYGKACRFFIYNSARLQELDSFTGDAGINVMIVNTQAFAAKGKDARRIYMKLDSFRSRRPIDVIGSARPIVIVDEPQSVLGAAGGANVTRDALGKFRPLFYLNYSATHRENFNMVYRLDAVDAYQQKLVKKISVKGISVKGTGATNGYLYLQRINVYPNKSPTATVTFEFNAVSGSGIQKRVRTFAHGDNLYDHSGQLSIYQTGYTIAEINARDGYVEFTSGLRLTPGEVVGDSSEDDIRRIQIRETISSHLHKERELFRRGIKVLSLFFIDEVAKYKSYNEVGEEVPGEYAQIFAEEYQNACTLLAEELPFDEDRGYREFLERDNVAQIHAGYFSIDNKGYAVNSETRRGQEGSDDTSAYDLIMKNKERLLSNDEPVRFIFSHSALKEGWDNPNVFQICTLRTSTAEIKKRQEIGRGLRLCVNQAGERMDGEVLGYDQVHDINALTVIANESYEDFAHALQGEMDEVLSSRPRVVEPAIFAGHSVVGEGGMHITISDSQSAFIFTALKQSALIVDGIPTAKYHELTKTERIEILRKQLTSIDEDTAGLAEPALDLVETVYDPKRQQMINNDRSTATLYLNQERFKGKAFLELWGKINEKTYYVTTFDDQKLVTRSIAAIDNKLNVSTLKIQITEGGLVSDGKAKPQMERTHNRDEDLISVATNSATYDLLGEIAEGTTLTRQVVADILRGVRADVFKCFAKNPAEFIYKAIKLINEQKASLVVECISYNPQKEQWQLEEIFTDSSIRGQYQVNIIDTEKHVYDKLRYDSEVEKRLAEDMDVADMVEVYAKLPNSFFIETPLGKYNPDWAIAFKQGAVKYIYFVAETKGSDSDLQLRAVEQGKISCAREHFKTIGHGTVKYDVVDSYEKLLEKVSETK